MGKVYSPEFRRKAVELFRFDEETTYVDVARELGCSAESGGLRMAPRDNGVTTRGRGFTRCRWDAAV